MEISTIAVDLAKNVFQLLGVDDKGHQVFSKRCNRNQFSSFMQLQPPCDVVMEACLSSHYWGRTFVKAGHNVRLLPAQHVTPFVRGNKNDKNDCLAIYEASQRPYLRSVPIKSEVQQTILSLHRLRERLIAARAACINQTHSLLLEFGVSTPCNFRKFSQELTEHLDNPSLHPVFRLMLDEVMEELRVFDVRLKRINHLIDQFNEQSPTAQILMSLPGVGPIIASAFSASIDRGQAFTSPDELAVWLGLTPKQHASGSSNRLGGITKRGDCYLRKQLIHGARTIVYFAHKRQDDFSRWIVQLKARRGVNKTVVATARKLARLMWILLQKNTRYQPQFLKENGQTI